MGPIDSSSVADSPAHHRQYNHQYEYISARDGEVTRADLQPVGIDPGQSHRVSRSAAGTSSQLPPTAGGGPGGSAQSGLAHLAADAFAEAPKKNLVFTHDPTDGWMRPNRLLTEDDMFRLSFFEKMFFMIDSDSNGYVTYTQLDRLFSFVAYRYSPLERERALGMGACYSHEAEQPIPSRPRKHDSTGVDKSTMVRDDGQRLDFSTGVDSNGDGVIDSQEFVRACAAHLWDVPLAMLELACRNFLEASALKVERNQFYWKKAARQVDKAARFWVVSSYFMALGWVCSTTLSDDYANPATDQMFQGVGPRVTSLVWVVVPACVFAVVLFTLLGWFRKSSYDGRHGDLSEMEQFNSNPMDHVMEGKRGHGSKWRQAPGAADGTADLRT